MDSKQGHASPRRPTARQRVRAEIQAEILEAAQRQMAVHGAGQISLRAIARELDMAPSAIHRYFPSRDDVITALLISQYTDLGEAMRAAMADSQADSPRQRFQAVFLAARRWALTHPHAWALLYGTPVPGYVAPEATKEPASAALRILAELLEVMGPGSWTEQPAGAVVPSDQAMEPTLAKLPEVPSWLAATAVAAWTWLIGAIGNELWGHYVNVVTEPTALFHASLDHWTDAMGLS